MHFGIVGVGRPHESSIVAEGSLLVGGACFHKAVAVNGWMARHGFS